MSDREALRPLSVPGHFPRRMECQTVTQTLRVELSGVLCPPQQSGGGTMAAGGAALADGFQFTSNLSHLPQ